MSLKILNLLLDFSLRAILKKFLIFAHFQPPIFLKMIFIKTNGVNYFQGIPASSKWFKWRVPVGY